MITDEEYKILASVRAELRTFAHFTEMNTRKAGLTPQQHQILLAIRASDRRQLTIGELAETMFLEPHSVSGLADRLAKLGLVERSRSDRDRRRVNLKVTARAEQLLSSLGQIHKAEMRRIRPLLIGLLSELT
jgi:DNA-binding MarR family transcriptional regulator